MKEKEVEIYAKCIDMRKKAMRESEKSAFEKDKQAYLLFKKFELAQSKQEYQYLLKLVNEIIDVMYFRVHKTNQKYCKFHPIKQEEIRSLKTFYEAQIEHLDFLLRKEEI